MKGRNRSWGVWFIAAIVISVMIVSRVSRERNRPLPPSLKADPSLILVTGYCDCEKCCSWKRSWFGFGRPVYAYGRMKGKPKKPGITATGTRTHHGTIAADPKVFAFGTRLEVPGYGTGMVEDIGGAIKGRHIDIWFSTHEEARRWGRRWLKVREIGGKD